MFDWSKNSESLLKEIKRNNETLKSVVGKFHQTAEETKIKPVIITYADLDTALIGKMVEYSEGLNAIRLPNTGYGSMVFRGTYEVGSVLIEHQHPDAYEEIIFIKGKVQSFDGKIYQEGDIMSLQPNTVHGWTVLESCETVVYLTRIDHYV